MIKPANDDEVIVNGVTLTCESSLATLRAACSAYGISTSGGKVKCFGRLLQHQKNIEIQTVTHAARDAINYDLRIPESQPLQEPPSEELQARHNLTHVPYEPWCASCIAHRARADRHPHDHSSKDGSVPTISFAITAIQKLVKVQRMQMVCLRLFWWTARQDMLDVCH